MDYYTMIEIELKRAKKQFEYEQMQLEKRYNNLMNTYGDILLKRYGKRIYNMNICTLEKLALMLVIEIN